MSTAGDDMSLHDVVLPVDFSDFVRDCFRICRRTDRHDAAQSCPGLLQVTWKPATGFHVNTGAFLYRAACVRTARASPTARSSIRHIFRAASFGPQLWAAYEPSG